MLVVQKYGGTSIGSPERIRSVADRIAKRRADGDRLVIVVSAMGETTDELLRLAAGVTETPSRRELDMLLTAGERISMALLSMALEARGVPAISFTGSQSGIITDSNHTRARIEDVRPIRIGPELKNEKVVIVAGFQGVSREKEVTTLGRGGSDTTAIALAIGLGADACEIYTDVPGILSADPRVVENTKRIPSLSWNAMLALARAGAGVMHSRAVALARKRRVAFLVRSAFHEEAGTMVEGDAMETGVQALAVTGRPEVLRVRISGAVLGGSQTNKFLDRLSALFEDVDGLDVTQGGSGWDTEFVTPSGVRVENAQKLAEEFGGVAAVDESQAAATVVSTGALEDPRLAASASRALASAGIHPSRIFTGSYCVTFLVPRASFLEAERALHAALIEVAEGRP